MLNISYPIAFVAGLASFFAPCLVPLLPAYIGYVAGVAYSDLKSNGYKNFKKKIIYSTLFYVLGFSAVFVLFGTAIGGVGALLRREDLLFQRIGGFIILLLGLNYTGFLKFTSLAKQKTIKLPSWTKRLGYFRSFIIGVIFATAWTPCIGPILGSILAYAAVSGTLVKGATLLFVYSMGISVPFLVVSLTLSSATDYIKFLTKNARVFSGIAGVLLISLGLLLLTDTYKYINIIASNIF
jgi:cytochrome c-type biogenesis protein